MHWFAAHTMMGRGNSLGMVNTNELFFLWCMMIGQCYSTDYFLCNHLRRMSHQATGHIMLGDLITAIALHFEFVPAHV